MNNYFDSLPNEIQAYILDIAKNKELWDMVMVELVVSVIHQVSLDGKKSTILNWTNPCSVTTYTEGCFKDPFKPFNIKTSFESVIHYNLVT